MNISEIQRMYLMVVKIIRQVDVAEAIKVLMFQWTSFLRVFSTALKGVPLKRFRNSSKDCLVRDSVI